MGFSQGLALTALVDFADPYATEAVDKAPSKGGRTRCAFGKPVQVLVAYTLAEVRGVIEAAHAAALAGNWCVGYLAFEAAPAFDTAFTVHGASAQALAWFAVYDHALPWPETPSSDVTVDWQALVPRADFDAALARIHAAIGAGDLYQVNYTAQMHGALRDVAATDAAACGPALFAALQRAQPGGYAAYLDTGASGQILSVSPELFFDWRDGGLLARPMKGTAARGSNPHDDAQRAADLRASPKERAENVMIVDLLRNDMSRVALPHSVQVQRLFHTQALPSVWQMTTDVLAQTRPDCTLWDVLAALFPCGSVTGAPKVQAMRMIHALEPEARGVYCGALGVLRPGGAVTFNVPIRTVTLRADAGEGVQARCGIGSGITFDAQPQGEWQEWQHKQAFVQRASSPFDLLETLRLQDGITPHRDAHLARMRLAAAHFGMPWDAARVHTALDSLAHAHPKGNWRVRLLLDARGQARCEAFALPDDPPQVRLQLANRTFAQAHSEFTRFKTTRRAHYDAFMPGDPAVFDTILWNEEGYVTECTRGNIAVLRDGVWTTPPASCGLLAGVGRARYLAEGRIAEGLLRVEDLQHAQGLAFINSLRGWIDARCGPE